MSYKFTQADKQVPRWPRLIKQARKKAGLSQKQFGELFGVSYAAVSDWERGVTDPPGDVTWWIHQQESKRGRK